MGPTLHDIRDSDMGAAITYLLLELEGVDAEPDILDEGKKGPWTIFSTSECSDRFKAKHGNNIKNSYLWASVRRKMEDGEEEEEGFPWEDPEKEEPAASGEDAA